MFTFCLLAKLLSQICCEFFLWKEISWPAHAIYMMADNNKNRTSCHRGRRNGRPIVRNAILALSDKWLSLDTRPMDEQIIIAQMSFINLRKVHIWFRTSADAMLLVWRTSASQISWQPSFVPVQSTFTHGKDGKVASPTGKLAGPAHFLMVEGLGSALNAKTGLHHKDTHFPSFLHVASAVQLKSKNLVRPKDHPFSKLAWRQEKFLSRKDLNDKNLTLFFAFVDLEKAFDRVPRKVLWWAMRKVGVEEWIVRLVQAMYNNARSQVRVGCEYSEEFEVGVGVHQGSVLSPLLFIIVLEALSRDFRVGVPWELFFADDLVIIATSLEECVERVKAWKEGLESKGLHVNMTKTKFMASGLGLDILQDSGKFPCAVCRTGVGRSSIRCSKCNLWVHYKKCSGLKTLSEDLSYECPRCRGVPGIRPVDGRPFKEVEVGDCVLEAVDRFCYLGDMLSAGGGCMAAATARCRCAWGKFRENLPLLTSKPVPFDLRGRLFSSNVRSSMLHGTETWPMTSAALHRLCRNDRAMIRWICGVKPSDDPSMDELHAKLGICDLAILVRERRLRWFGHVMRSNGEINRVRSRPVPGRKGPGRPKKTWEECVKQDLKVCGLSEAGTQDRLSWRSSVKNSRQEPTPSNGSLLQSMAAPPARRVLGMRTRSFNKTGFDWLIDWSPAQIRHIVLGCLSSFSLFIMFNLCACNFCENCRTNTKISESI